MMSRNRRPRMLGIAGAAVLLAAVAAGCGPRESAAPAGGRLRVAASIFPLADVARQIGGDDVEILTLLPAGTSPHGFEPGPRQVEQLARCRLLLVVGLGMDSWAEQAARAGGTRLRTLRFADVAGRPAGDDPHLWLDPVLMKAFVRAAADAMAELDPARAAAYRKRAAAFAEKLDTLDAEYRRALGRVRRKAFVSFHPAFGHLARRYGLTQETLTAAPGHEGGPERLEHAVKFVKKHHLKVIFAEPQFPADKLRWLAEQTGASVGRLDPLGNPAVRGYDSYPAMMRSNLKALVAALSE